MSIQSYLLSGSNFKKAKTLTQEAQHQTGEKADQLFQQAYDCFSAISPSYSKYADTVHCWGFSIINQAQTKTANDAIKLFEQAIDKFSLCKTITPQHLGAAVDGGVALLGLAEAKELDLTDELYQKAKKSFEAAEKIQSGSASYNLACIYALQNKGDACLKALENAREHGLIPDEKDIIDDDDLQNVKKLSWFAEYIESLSEEQAEN